ncbi:phage tail protein [Aeromonas caviae]|uniref:phage tail protein n=1 Tax=Aeromonas caviae TaxID=648 RepID=UPI0025B7368F|nr:phage tail protein [Aeromonas caviae]
MSAIYFAILTDTGQAKMANALALGVPLKITHMAVGDGNGQPVTPNAAQTALVRERRRAPINTLFQDPTNQSQLVAEQIIPENVGDWWIREAGIFSEDGTLIAIANTPDTYKPLLSSGAGRTQVIRIVLIVSDTSAVELKIDPAVVLATRKYVDDLMAAHKQSREHPDASETAKGFTRYATQAEVNETVTANQKADAVVTVKTLWGWVKQASESVLGMMKVATQAQTNAGVADDVSVTPKKLRAGFAVSLAANGYIAFPTWMGGVIIQWGGFIVNFTTAPQVIVQVVTLPMTFPTSQRAVMLEPFTSSPTQFAEHGFIPTNNSQFTAYVNGKSNTAQEYRWVAIGY